MERQLTEFQNAIISVVHTEPDYSFVQVERKAILRMAQRGLVKLKTNSNGLTGATVTAKGEKLYGWKVA